VVLDAVISDTTSTTTLNYLLFTAMYLRYMSCHVSMYIHDMSTVEHMHT